MTRIIVFRVSSDQWRAMPTSTIQPSPQKILPLSAHPTHPTQSQLPHSHLKNSPAPNNPSAPTPPPNRTTQIPAPTSNPSPPLYQFTSRTRREARNTSLTHAPCSNIGVLRTDGWCCFYCSKTTSANFLRSGDSGSTLHRLVGIIRFDFARNSFIALPLSTFRPPSSSLPFPSLRSFLP
jgi:hypothetical protein